MSGSVTDLNWCRCSKVRHFETECEAVLKQPALLLRFVFYQLPRVWLLHFGTAEEQKDGDFSHTETVNVNIREGRA
jgi:hypothetical protein